MSQRLQSIEIQDLQQKLNVTQRKNTVEEIPTMVGWIFSSSQ